MIEKTTHQTIANFKMYIPSKMDERVAGEKIKELVEQTTNITNVYRYDILYGEMRFRGTLNGESVSILWLYQEDLVVLEGDVEGWQKRGVDSREL